MNCSRAPSRLLRSTIVVVPACRPSVCSLMVLAAYLSPDGRRSRRRRRRRPRDVRGVGRLLRSRQQMPVDPEVVVGTLPNGLRYYVRPNAKPARRAELRLVVKAGSVLEDDDQRGLAHFVEHMQFEGTTQLSRAEHQRVPRRRSA